VKLIVSEEAVADLVRLRDFPMNRNPGAAQRATAAIANAIRSLDPSPERGRPSGANDTRELVVPFGRSAYILRYAILTEENEIVILRVWHGREQRD
jgi:plasmid stabilization system protein ParE